MSESPPPRATLGDGSGLHQTFPNKAAAGDGSTLSPPPVQRHFTGFQLEGTVLQEGHHQRRKRRLTDSEDREPGKLKVSKSDAVTVVEPEEDTRPWDVQPADQRHFIHAQLQGTAQHEGCHQRTRKQSDAVTLAEPEEDTRPWDVQPADKSHFTNAQLQGTAQHEGCHQRTRKRTVTDEGREREKLKLLKSKVDSSVVDTSLDPSGGDPHSEGHVDAIGKTLEDDMAVDLPVFSVRFRPLLEFLSTHQLVRWVSYPSKLSDIVGFDHEAVDTEMDRKKKEEEGDYDIENTEAGQWLADGFVSEIVATHKKGLSWGGDFLVTDMFLSTIGKFVHLLKDPTKSANLLNQILDFDALANILFLRYVKGKKKKMPPYLEDFLARLRKLKEKALQLQEEHLESHKRNLIELQVEKSLMVLANHLFFMEPIKFKHLLESYYRYYKTLDSDDSYEQITDRNKNICGNWHIARVREDKLLRAMYWLKDKKKPPKDYLLRKNTDFVARDNNYSIYPFTPADGYLALFLRCCLVHGAQIALCKFGRDRVLTTKEILSIMAHYFEEFMPEFLEDIFFLLHSSDPHLDDAVKTYLHRATKSWRAVCSAADKAMNVESDHSQQAAMVKSNEAVDGQEEPEQREPAPATQPEQREPAHAAAPLSPVSPLAVLWHYRDDDKRTYGPFSLMRLSHWVPVWKQEGCNVENFRVWKTGQTYEKAILLCDAFWMYL